MSEKAMSEELQSRAQGPYRVACDNHNEHKPIFTDGRPLLDDRCPWCVIDGVTKTCEVHKQEQTRLRERAESENAALRARVEELEKENARLGAADAAKRANADVIHCQSERITDLEAQVEGFEEIRRADGKALEEITAYAHRLEKQRDDLQAALTSALPWIVLDCAGGRGAWNDGHSLLTALRESAELEKELDT